VVDFALEPPLELKFSSRQASKVFHFTDNITTKFGYLMFDSDYFREVDIFCSTGLFSGSYSIKNVKVGYYLLGTLI
jgi:hypothetical protein